MVRKVSFELQVLLLFKMPLHHGMISLAITCWMTHIVDVKIFATCHDLPLQWGAFAYTSASTSTSPSASTSTSGQLSSPLLLVNGARRVGCICNQPHPLHQSFAINRT